MLSPEPGVEVEFSTGTMPVASHATSRLAFELPEQFVAPEQFVPEQFAAGEACILRVPIMFARPV